MNTIYYPMARGVLLSLLFTFSFLLLPLFANSADYFWVGGSGNWSDLSHWATSSGGGTFHATVPQSTDDVFFDANSSFTLGNNMVMVDETIIFCKNMDWTGAPNSPKFLAATDKMLFVYGSIKLINNIEWLFDGEVHFLSFQMGNTITTAGSIFRNSIFFEGPNGGWELLDDLSTMSNNYFPVFIKNGSFTTNGHTLTVNQFFVETQNDPININLGNSTINITYDFGQISISDNLGLLSFDAGTSHFIIHGNNASIATYAPLPLAVDFYEVTFLKNGMFFTDNNFFDLNFSSGFIYTITSGATQGILPGGHLNASGTGCDSFITIKAYMPPQQANISVPSGNVNLDYVALQNINATGGASYTASNSADLGGNAGWTINPITPRQLYWVGGGGDWNEVSHWSLASGGTGGECIPTAYDDVFFDANSGFAPTEVVTANNDLIFCRDVTWGNVPNNPIFTNDGQSDKWYVFGSLTFNNSMINSYIGEVHFMGTTTGKTVTSAGQVFSNSVYFNGIGGGWDLLDDFSMGGGNNYFPFFLQSGTLKTNGHALTVNNFIVQSENSPTALILGSSTINITYEFGQLFMNNNNNILNLDAGTSHFILHGGQAEILTFSATPLTIDFYEVTFLKNGTFFTDNNFFGLNLSPNYTYALVGGSNQTILLGGHLSASGTGCDAFVTIKSEAPPIQASISKSSGPVSENYLILQNINATGGASYVAANSVDLGGNTGWAINPVSPRQLYWVGGNGDWNENNHWALTSGGAGGECVPTPYDDVFFDANSGFASGDIVTANNSIIYCRDVTWGNVPSNTLFTNSNSQDNWYIFGSLTFSNPMAYGYYGEVYFMATDNGNTVTTAGKQFMNIVYFNGDGGTWDLADDFNMIPNNYYPLYINSGTLNTNGHTLNLNQFFIESTGNPVAVHLGNSTIYITYDFGQIFILDNYDQLVFDAGTSNFVMQGNNASIVNFVIPPFGGPFYEVTFLKDGEIYTNNYFYKLNFSPGHTYLLHEGTTQTIAPLGDFNVQGNGSFPIELKSNQLGTQATIHKDGDPICLDYLFLTDINATGTGFAYAGANSNDVFNNNGFIFGVCPACFTAPPTAAPVLDQGASNLITVQGGSVTLVLQNIPVNHEIVWYDENKTTELYSGTVNFFQPTVNEATSFFAALRDLSTGCLTDFVEAEASLITSAAVPTLGEWGLILLALLVSCIGLVAIRQEQLILVNGKNHSFSFLTQNLPFMAGLYSKCLLVIGIGLIFVFLLSVLFFGYEMTSADVPGSLAALPLGAYLLHLLWVEEI